jgi:hypothetical protein
MENRRNNGLPHATPGCVPPAHAMSFFSGLLAFGLSAIMAIGFIALVNKTHDLLSVAQVRAYISARQ